MIVEEGIERLEWGKFEPGDKHTLRFLDPMPRNLYERYFLGKWEPIRPEPETKPTIRFLRV